MEDLSSSPHWHVYPTSADVDFKTDANGAGACCHQVKALSAGTFQLSNQSAPDTPMEVVLQAGDVLTGIIAKFFTSGSTADITFLAQWGVAKGA